jgi:hypothetical protein
MRAARKFSTHVLLATGNCLSLAHAWFMLAIVDVRLRAFGFRRTAHRAVSLGHRPGRPEDVQRAYEYARWLRIAARHHLVRARCLHQALALHHWLRRRRLRSELRIGVRMAGAGLRAHAWVELAGHVLDEHPAAVGAFTELTSARLDDGFGWTRATRGRDRSSTPWAG